MQANKVDECLENYREYAARCAYLEKQIEELELWIQEMRSTFIEDNISITATISDMPHGTAISNPVQRLAIMDIESYTPDYIKTVQKELRQKKWQLSMKRPTVVFVQSWIMCLTPRERFIVQRQVLDGMYWRDIIVQFKKQYGDQYTRQGLKRIRDNAINKIYKIAE